MICSVKDRITAAILAGRCPKGFPADLFRPARRRLALIEAAERLDDLRSPSGSKLHSLHGNRVRQHAIRINDQFRICFRWTEAGAEDVEIADYH